jgi:outer membrane autotransporter protein
LYFSQSADAGTARIHLAVDTSEVPSSRVEFRGSSSAANATILNEATPLKVALAFLDDSSAGHARIENRNISWAGFAHSASASHATITNESGGATRFEDSATAVAAVITKRATGYTVFTGSSSAGDAVIKNESGGAIYFSDFASGANARVINRAGGILDITGLAGAGTTLGSIEGAGTFQLGSKRLTVGGTNLSREVSGAIEGVGGSLTKTGSGTLILSGTSSLSGSTVVEAGGLIVTGSLAHSPVTVSGGRLGGTGTVGGIVAESGATVAPGNSIGTLKVDGNVSFGLGSTYQVEVNAAGQSDRIAATGTATLSGGRMQVLAESGRYQLATRYTILTADGGVSGTFGSVSSNFAYLDPTLTYSPNEVSLTLVRKTVPTDPTDPTDPEEPAPTPVAFHSVTVSSNQYRVADAVEALGAGQPLFDAVVGQSVAGARQAFDALSGEAHGSVVGAAMSGAMQTQNLLMGRLHRLGTDATGQGGAFQAAYAADGPGAQPTDTIVLPSLDPRRFALWGEGFGTWGRIAGNGNAAGLDTATGGFLIGGDARIGDAFRLGVAGGFSRTTFDIAGRLSEGATETTFGALYGGASWGAVNLRLGALYAWHDIDTTRTISFPGFADRASASYDGSTLMAFGEIGYALDLGAVQLEPFVGASVLRLRTDRFQETGGPAALTGLGQEQDLATTTLGMRAEARLGEGIPLLARGMVGWRHAFGDVNPTALLAFAGGASPFAVSGVPVDRNALAAEAGLDWQLAPDMTLGVAYNGQIGARAQEHALKGNFTWRF